MVCTVEQAKTKICPQMTAWGPGDPSREYPHDLPELAHVYCMADLCALWENWPKESTTGVMGYGYCGLTRQ